MGSWCCVKYRRVQTNVVCQWHLDYQGGKHVDYISNQIAGTFVRQLSERKGGCQARLVKENLMVFVKADCQSLV